MTTLRATILGCGSSGGVPRIGGHWGDCDPAEPRNRRRRCSLLLEQTTEAGTTRVLIDASPDLREQLLDAGVGRLDAVVFTHPHADHVHGLDDLRMVVMNIRRQLDAWADVPTRAALLERFGYVFETPKNSDYPPILNLRDITGPFAVEGAGGPLRLHPFTVTHGRIPALGFRAGPLAYLPDVQEMTEAAWDEVARADTWVLDCLRRAPHPSHSHLAQSLHWIAQSGVRRGVLTNMHNDLDYATLCAEVPANVTPAHDGMVLTFPL